MKGEICDVNTDFEIQGDILIANGLFTGQKSTAMLQ